MNQSYVRFVCWSVGRSVGRSVGFSWSSVDPLLSSLPDPGMNTHAVSKAFFPREWEGYILEGQGLPSSCVLTVFLVMFGTPGHVVALTERRTAEPVGETSLAPPPCLALLWTPPHRSMFV